MASIMRIGKDDNGDRKITMYINGKMTVSMDVFARIKLHNYEVTLSRDEVSQLYDTLLEWMITVQH